MDELGSPYAGLEMATASPSLGGFPATSGSASSGSSTYQSSGQPVMIPGMQSVYNQLFSQNLGRYQNVMGAYNTGMNAIGPGVQGAVGGLQNTLGGVMNTLGMGGALGQNGNWGVAQPAYEAIKNMFANQQGQTTQQMTSAGLGNTTVTGNLQNQNAYLAGQNIAGLGANLAQTAAGYQGQIGQAMAGTQMQGLGMLTGLAGSALNPLGQQMQNTAGQLWGNQSSGSGSSTQKGQSGSQGGQPGSGSSAGGGGSLTGGGNPYIGAAGQGGGAGGGVPGMPGYNFGGSSGGGGNSYDPSGGGGAYGGGSPSGTSPGGITGWAGPTGTPYGQTTPTFQQTQGGQGTPATGGGPAQPGGITGGSSVGVTPTNNFSQGPSGGFPNPSLGGGIGGQMGGAYQDQSDAIQAATNSLQETGQVPPGADLGTLFPDKNDPPPTTGPGGMAPNGWTFYSDAIPASGGKYKTRWVPK